MALDLLLGLQNAHQLPGVVRDELEQAYAAIQQWQIGTFKSGTIAERLALKVYAPSTAAAITSGAAFADISTANLYVTPKATTTRALVRLTAYASYNNAGNTYAWNLRTGTTNIAMTGGIVATGVLDSVVCMSFVMDNLIAGRSYTWKWGHRSSAGAATFRAQQGGTGYPAAIMEVWSL